MKIPKIKLMAISKKQCIRGTYTCHDGGLVKGGMDYLDP
jgi:hypothetical protein